MANFPGIAMIIDDQFDLVYKPATEDREQTIQRHSLLTLKEFLENNTIPFVALSNTQDFGQLKDKINGYDNVRLLVLDLDLNNDGSVGEEDDIPLIKIILANALSKFGYFFLLINSAHSAAWDEIKKTLEGDIDVFSKKNSAVEIYDKGAGDFTDILIALQEKNYSLELIYDFECSLNKARDKAFHGLIDNEKRTWNKIYHQFVVETSTQAGFVLSTAYLSIIKQYLLDTKYSNPTNVDPIDETLIKKAFGLINYIDNINGSLGTHPIWTGNLYKMEKPLVPHMNYALLITPECDIAQNKLITYQIVLGYEVNEHTFPEGYNPKDYKEIQPPLHALKAGKSSGKWKERENLKTGFIEHLYTLPFSSSNGKTVILDFRDITFVPKIVVENWILLKRINDPMVTDILDKISAIFNRKGILPLLPKTVKIIP